MKQKYFYEFEEFRLDVERQRLYCSGDLISLPPKAVELLTLLVENQGQVLEKDQLIEILWQDTFVEDANLTQTIYLLRKALGKKADGEPMIATFPKRGYKFVPEVKKIADQQNALTVTKLTEEHILISEEVKVTEIFEPATEPVPAEKRLVPVKPGLKDKLKTVFSNRRRLAALNLAVLVVCLAAWLGWQSSRANHTGKINSIAVLPFKIIGEQKNDYLALGLADTLITRLGQTGKIQVRSTEEVRRYAEAIKDDLEIGRQMKVDSILTGNIHYIDNQMRFTTQLVRISDGQVLWTDQFDENETNLFALQDEITRRLTNSLTLKLSSAEQKEITKNTTENVEAYKLYWQGRHHWNKRTPEWIRKAIICFKEAIRLDPNYAEAYAGLADSYALTVSGLPSAERFPKAKNAARRALELDETLAEAHTSLAFVTYKADWDNATAEKHFRRAIELNDSYPTAHHWFGEFLALLGRFDEGLNELRRAEQIDPFSLAIKIDIGEALYRTRRYDEAEAQARKVLEFDPNFAQAYRILKRIYIQKGLPAEAVKADLELLRSSEDAPPGLAELKKTFDTQGWRSYWRERLKLQEKDTRLTPMKLVDVIETQIILGENEKAIAALKRILAEKEIFPARINIEPMFDPLRSDARFVNLLR